MSGFGISFNARPDLIAVLSQTQEKLSNGHSDLDPSSLDESMNSTSTLFKAFT